MYGLDRITRLGVEGRGQVGAQERRSERRRSPHHIRERCSPLCRVLYNRRPTGNHESYGGRPALLGPNTLHPGRDEDPGSKAIGPLLWGARVLIQTRLLVFGGEACLEGMP